MKAFFPLRFLRLFLCVSAFISIPSAKGADMLVIFGTHDSGPGKGFSISHFDSDTGKLSPPKFALEATAPGYFVIAPDGKHIYSCNSLNNNATVSAYSIDARAEKMALINSVPSGGGDPSFITLDAGAHHALVANYQGGNVAVFAIKRDGSLGARTGFDQHTGHSVDASRQSRPFTHSVRLDPTGHFALVCDLGVDKVFIYRYDAKAGTITANDPPYADIAPGSGPRHFDFHPNGKWMYMISEMASTITCFNWDAKAGRLERFQTISSLPPGFSGTNTAAEILVHPNGKYLYASNRGDDSIVQFSIDPDNGRLSFAERVSSGGKTPRNFAIDPTGRWLLATNHGSNAAAVFAIDHVDGELDQTGDAVAVPYPFCPRFLPAP